MRGPGNPIAAELPVLDSGATPSNTAPAFFCLRNRLKTQTSTGMPSVFARSATPHNIVPAISRWADQWSVPQR
jgi:hypothetical protein